jgi:hypothetical protein
MIMVRTWLVQRLRSGGLRIGCKYHYYLVYASKVFAGDLH